MKKHGPFLRDFPFTIKSDKKVRYKYAKILCCDEFVLLLFFKA